MSTPTLPPSLTLPNVAPSNPVTVDAVNRLHIDGRHVCAWCLEDAGTCGCRSAVAAHHAALDAAETGDDPSVVAS